jgi:hypothetical protein
MMMQFLGSIGSGSKLLQGSLGSGSMLVTGCLGSGSRCFATTTASARWLHSTDMLSFGFKGCIRFTVNQIRRGYRCMRVGGGPDVLLQEMLFDLHGVWAVGGCCGRLQSYSIELDGYYFLHTVRRGYGCMRHAGGGGFEAPGGIDL